jgi:3'-phosphoadenosine 5'-phosphosulfate (PAPS) 3'-phosphatase
VTIADFAVQALVIYYLSECFPSDLFIAEESSELLRENKVCICSHFLVHSEQSTG